MNAPTVLLPDSRVSTPAERAIFDRLPTHPNASRLPANIPLDTHRYYLAFSPNGNTAVLRLKNRAELAEWCTRQWHMFPDPPVIRDVTMKVLEALESVLDLPNEEFDRAQLWVSVEEGFRFIAHPQHLGRPLPSARPLWMRWTEGGIIGTLCPEIDHTGRTLPDGDQQ